MSFMKGASGKEAPAGSIAASVGQLVGGAMGTGGGSSGSMAGLAGQAIGGAMGTPGGQDGSFGAGLGKSMAGMFGKQPPEAPPAAGATPPTGATPPGGTETTKPPAEEEKKEPTISEQLPGLVGSLSGETRMKGCWKRAYYRSFGEIPNECGPDQTRSGLWCFQNCQKGWSGFSRTCYKDCPPEVKSGYMGTCKRLPDYPYGPGSTKPCANCKKIGLKYYEDCKTGFKQSGKTCKAQCPSGTKDAGWQGCKKDTYQR